jgi:hypothetical protein
MIRALISLVLISACATTPAPARPRLTEYFVDPEAKLLRGPNEFHDVVLDTCYWPHSGRVMSPTRMICYALSGPDYQRLLEYVATLEAQSKSCVGRVGPMP